MNILVVGASGFVGKNLLLSMPKDWNVFGMYRTDNTFPDFLGKNNLDNVRPIRCDLENSKNVKDVLESVADPVDACVYLAANTSVSKLVEDPVLDVNTNISPMLNFLRYFRGRRLVFLSSGAVYMGLEGKVSPSSRMNPTIPYSISKYASELYIKFYQNSKKTFEEYVILRFFGAYGPYEPSRKISTKLLEVVRNPRENRFTTFGDGENLIDFLYIDDAVKGLFSVIASPKANVTADFCSGTPRTINELVKDIGQIFNKEIHIEHAGESPEYIKFYASSEKMLKLFDFRPCTSLENGFKRFADWLDRHSKNNA